MADLLADDYDAVLLDLDGVVYLGPVPVPGAPEALTALRRRGVRVGFVTNNAARSPFDVAAHLSDIGVPAEGADVVTAAQAGARLLRERFDPGVRVLAVGGEGVRQALVEADLIAVASADDDPVAVLQGWGPELTWNDLNEAAIAIHHGAHWVATNIDPTRPTDRGLVPGNGAAVAAVRQAVEIDPEVAGKPYPPLLTQTVARLGTRRPLFVGDRLDTDIAGGRRAGMDTLLVLSGAHGPSDLLSAAEDSRPVHLGRDLGALLRPARVAVVEQDRARCGEAYVSLVDGALHWRGDRSAQPEERIDALWAAAQLSWHAADQGRTPDPSEFLSRWNDAGG